MKNSRYYTKCITAGRAKEGLRADWQEHLKTVQKEIGFEYIRFHGIFHDDMAIYDEDENGNPKFYFGYFDKLVDFLQSVNLKLILELGFLPEKLVHYILCAEQAVCRFFLGTSIPDILAAGCRW